ncbi:hypothetical protein [Caballeronia sp. ATUFL_M1_KS5A]|uniref:hypothetical protein n=1 Tax=Caballeronia sp. ATUFL_M1_KS5A TaxID=2921778 RepID=UPI0020280D08|nr:hypothetical protein [Caballeronia sp. ATUFL_M1_KS5A]
MNKLSRREITCTMSADFLIFSVGPRSRKQNAQQELLGSTGYACGQVAVLRIRPE